MRITKSKKEMVYLFFTKNEEKKNKTNNSL